MKFPLTIGVLEGCVQSAFYLDVIPIIILGIILYFFCMPLTYFMKLYHHHHI
jgi:hypothetical protein